MINWNATKEDHDLASKIVKRFIERQRELGLEESDYGDTEMDIIAVHCNDCELDLAGLLEAENFDFMHDVAGIIGHIDRKTGKLTDCFRPRYTKR